MPEQKLIPPLKGSVDASVNSLAHLIIKTGVKGTKTVTFLFIFRNGRKFRIDSRNFRRYATI